MGGQRNKVTAIERLRNRLGKLPAGPVKGKAKEQVEQLLAECWDSLGGDDGGMRPDKLEGRTEKLAWNPPVLSFIIERHGGTVMGSSRAELQKWSIDVKKGDRDVSTGRYRQLTRRQPPLDVKPLAEEVAQLIKQHKVDPRLTWRNEDLVCVDIGQLIPKDAAVQSTITGRRTRFWRRLDELLEKEWKRLQVCYERQREEPM